MVDSGADEFSPATIVRKPLTTSDVGPNWGTNQPTGNYVAIQAEGFSRITDPNGDGETWQIIQDNAAHGGLALEANQGSRTDLSNSPHDSLALYDIVFAEAGEYTAYYRAYGVNGASDSFFAPSDFNLDPTIIETTSSNGVYAWVIGEEFTITDSDIGVPLELRLGRREGFNRLDSIVFHQSGDLTASELDALFSAVPEPGAALLLSALLPWAILRRRR